MPQEILILTPENQTIRFRLAGPAVRWKAFMTDAMVQTELLIVLSILHSSFEGFFRSSWLWGGLFTAESFFIIWAYHLYFEVWGDGQTPGKRRMGLRVVSENGQPIGFFASFLRNVLRVADFLPLFFVAGFCTTLVTRNQQRLGDLAAQSLVIYDQIPDPNDQSI